MFFLKSTTVPGSRMVPKLITAPASSDVDLNGCSIHTNKRLASLKFCGVSSRHKVCHQIKERRP